MSEKKKQYKLYLGKAWNQFHKHTIKSKKNKECAEAFFPYEN